MRGLIQLRGRAAPLELPIDSRAGLFRLPSTRERRWKMDYDHPRVNAVYGVLLNFRSDLEAMGAKLNEPPYKAPPREPVLYIKPRNTWSAHQDPIPLPQDAPAVQVGATLGLLVGRDISYGKPGEVEHCISGLTVVNEVSLPHAEVFRPAIKQRCRDGFCPMGPWVVLADAAQVTRRHVMRTYINEELKHECSTDELVRAVPQLLADISSFMTLHAGALVTIGVRHDTPLAKVGDSVTVEVDGIGRFENTIVQEEHWSSDT